MEARRTSIVGTRKQNGYIDFIKWELAECDILYCGWSWFGFVVLTTVLEEDSQF